MGPSYQYDVNGAVSAVNGPKALAPCIDNSTVLINSSNQLYVPGGITAATAPVTLNSGVIGLNYGNGLINNSSTLSSAAALGYGTFSAGNVNGYYVFTNKNVTPVGMAVDTTGVKITTAGTYFCIANCYISAISNNATATFELYLDTTTVLTSCQFQCTSYQYNYQATSSMSSIVNITANQVLNIRSSNLAYATNYNILSFSIIRIL